MARWATVVALALWPWAPVAAQAASPFDLRPALELTSSGPRDVATAMPDVFRQGWASTDPVAKLSALRTLAVHAVFRFDALKLVTPHLGEGLALAEKLGDKPLSGLLQALKAAADHVAHGTADGGRQRRDDQLAKADALLERAGDPTARCLGKYLHGNLLSNENSYAVWMQPLLSGLALQDASPACHSWIVALIHRSNGRLVTEEDSSKLNAAVAEIRQALARTPPERYPVLAGRLLVSLGTLHLRAGQFAQSEAPLRRAAELAREVRDSRLEVSALDGLQHTYIGLKRPREVLALLVRDAAINQGESNDDAGIRAMRVAEVNAMLDPPDRGAALAALGQAEQLFAGKPDNRLSRRLLEVRAYVYERLGDPARALAETKLLYETSRRRVVETYSARLAELQTQYDVKVQALEAERLKSSVDALTARRNLFGVSLVAAVAVLGTLVLLYRRQVQQKRRLVTLYGQLEQLNATRSEFLAAACHDLRQPAQSLALLAEVAHGRGGAGPREVENIRHQSDLMGDMLSSLLDMAQLERADLTVNEGPVSLDALFDDAARQFQPVAARKGLALAAPHTGLWVRSDAQLLRRVLFNLLSNACKYTDHGTVALAAAAVPDAQVAVTVTDTGRGIPAERIADMLRPYTRLDHGTAEPGLGIGLSVVQRAVQRLGHGLAIDSAVGRGTTVRLSLPVCEAPAAAGDAAAAVAAPATDATASPPAARRALVAVVDDQPEILATLAELVAQWGHEAVTATDEAGLLARLQGRRPDMLLLDLNIGADSGLALATRLMQHQPGWASVACVLFTGTVSADVETQARAQGLQVLFKPVRPSVLKRTIDRTLAGPRGDPQTAPH